jgi:hypothetical protein
VPLHRAMMRDPIETRSFLPVLPAVVWARITTFEGINDEFTPLFRMTAPAPVRERGLEGVVRGRRLCRSWVAVSGGCILIDRIRYEPRVPLPDVAWRTLYTTVFRHRHRRLQRRFGGRSL